MKFFFHPEADEEFSQAIDYYEQVQLGLGYDFAIEVSSTIARIVEFPRAWPSIEEDIHRCLTKRFPYGILYSIEQKKIYILAVMHLNREPGYWKYRK